MRTDIDSHARWVLFLRCPRGAQLCHPDLIGSVGPIGGNNDDPLWNTWTDAFAHRAHIARVNRTGYGKKFWIVVDTFRLAGPLKDVLEVCVDEDVDGASQRPKFEVPLLRDRHLRAVDLFRRRRFEGLDDHEGCFEVLADERLRAECAGKLKQFLE